MSSDTSMMLMYKLGGGAAGGAAYCYAMGAQLGLTSRMAECAAAGAASAYLMGMFFNEYMESVAVSSGSMNDTLIYTGKSAVYGAVGSAILSYAMSRV